MKDQIVCRAIKYETSNGEYAHWEIEFIKLEYYRYSKRYSQSGKSLITFNVQMDRERGFSIWKSYGGRCTNVNMDGGLKDAKKILAKIDGLYGPKSLAKIARSYPRYKYVSLTDRDKNDGFYGYVPRKHSKDPVLWIKAMRAGYELKKA